MSKKRGTNFSNTEKVLLVEIITLYKDIIENKTTNAVCSKKKAKCWDTISKTFNSESSIFRDTLTLRSCWENLKKRTRKYYAEERRQLYKTGKIIIMYIFMVLYKKQEIYLILVLQVLILCNTQMRKKYCILCLVIVTKIFI